jgi:hypothetical protein
MKKALLVDYSLAAATCAILFIAILAAWFR